jgi:hypothetical protein
VRRARHANVPAWRAAEDGGSPGRRRDESAVA